MLAPGSGRGFQHSQSPQPRGADCIPGQPKTRRDYHHRRPTYSSVRAQVQLL